MTGPTRRIPEPELRDPHTERQAGSPITPKITSGITATSIPADVVGGVAKLVDVLGPKGAIERLRAMLIEAGATPARVSPELVIRVARIPAAVERLAGPNKNAATVAEISQTVADLIGQLVGGAK